MLENYDNKQITQSPERKSAKGKASKKRTKKAAAKLRKFTFTGIGKTVEATDLEAALKIINKDKAK